MKPIKVTLEFEEKTANTYRYRNDDSDDCPIPFLLIRQSYFPEPGVPPQLISIVVEDPDPENSTTIPGVSVDMLLDAVKRSNFGTDNPGFCIKCGAEAMNVEPDAEKYECESCGEKAVYGAEQLLLLGYAGGM